jgi:hypothetical protein
LSGTRGSFEDLALARIALSGSSPRREPVGAAVERAAQVLGERASLGIVISTM